MKWRKKPVVIEAIKFTDNVEEIEQFVGQQLLCNMNGTGVCQELLIPTLEGEMTAKVNDWILKGSPGEFYPCKPDRFQKNYEPADESPSLSSAEEAIGWTTTKPKFDREFSFATASYYKHDGWEYKIWQIVKVDGPGILYYALCEGDGEEWGDHEDLQAELYYILPQPL